MSKRGVFLDQLTDTLYAFLVESGAVPEVPRLKPGRRHPPRSAVLAIEAARHLAGGNKPMHVGISIDAELTARRGFRRLHEKPRDQWERVKRFGELFLDAKKEIEDRLSPAGRIDPNERKRLETLARRYAVEGRKLMRLHEEWVPRLNGTRGPQRSLVVAQYHAARALEPREEWDRLRRALDIFIANYAEETARRQREAIVLLGRRASLDPKAHEVRERFKGARWLNVRYRGGQGEGIDLPALAIYEWKPGEVRAVPEPIARELLRRTYTVSLVGADYGKRRGEFVLVDGAASHRPVAKSVAKKGPTGPHFSSQEPRTVRGA